MIANESEYKQENSLFQARQNMLLQQLRPMGIHSSKLFDIFVQVVREDFVPERQKSLAYADVNLSLDANNHMLTPTLEAQILQVSDVKPTDRVLVIGTGSGYLTALLAKLAKQVVSVEIDPHLIQQAEDNINHYALTNIRLKHGDVFNSDLQIELEKEGFFDVIVVTGSVSDNIEYFSQHLARSGRLFCVIGHSHTMQATLITKTQQKQFNTHVLFETYLPALLNIPNNQNFTL